MLRCPRCQGENLDDAQFCDSCGSHLGASAAGPAAAPPLEGPTHAPPLEGPAPARASCPSCGRPTPAGAQFCARCGKTLGVEYASFWRRFGGYLLDVIIVAIGTSIISVVSAVTITGALAPVVTLVIALAYYVLLNANGGTLGKQAVGIRLEDAETGDDVGVPRSIGRYVVAIVSGLALLIGYLWCIWDDRKQTWHDKAVGSIVVRA